jgi:hypothetical protein
MLRGKRVDFVLCDPSTSGILAGIEMDENAATGPERAERERFIDDLFASNGLPLLRVPVKGHEELERLRDWLGRHELMAARASGAGTVRDGAGV